MALSRCVCIRCMLYPPSRRHKPLTPKRMAWIEVVSVMPHSILAAPPSLPVVYVIIIHDNTCSSVPGLAVNDVFTPWTRPVHTSISGSCTLTLMPMTIISAW